MKRGRFQLLYHGFLLNQNNIHQISCVYSEIVNITADNSNDKRAVVFEESKDAESGEVIWEKKNLTNMQFFHDLIKGELEEIKESSNEEYKDSLNNILKEQKCTSAHSLTFLKWIEEMSKVLEKKDSIHFSIKDEHPIRVEIDFTKLGNSQLLYFLAPRALKDELDEELEDF